MEKPKTNQYRLRAPMQVGPNAEDIQPIGTLVMLTEKEAAGKGKAVELVEEEPKTRTRKTTETK